MNFWRNLALAGLLTVSLSAGCVASAPKAEAADIVGCVLRADRPVYNYDVVYGVGEQTCIPGLYQKQRVRIRLQEYQKTCAFIIVCTYGWHTKYITTWSNWTVQANKARSGILDCDRRSWHKWRVWVDGQFINDRGNKRIGADFSLNTNMPCHVKADVTL